MSINAEKDFDRVNWQFLRATLEHFELVSSTTSWIFSLHPYPSAIKVNETRSGFFINGTCQGCPLSPLNFILSLEPFLCSVRADPDIAGYKKVSGLHKVVAFADDLIDSGPFIVPAAIASIAVYIWCTLSYFQTNLCKSTALNILVDHLLHWHSLTLIWFGSCSALKMTILPRVLYLLQALPIQLPPVFFKCVNPLFQEFIRSHRKPRIQLQLLHLPKWQGGVGLPDIRAYYKAAHLTRLIDWHCHADAKHWVAKMEDCKELPIYHSFAAEGSQSRSPEKPFSALRSRRYLVP